MTDGPRAAHGRYYALTSDEAACRNLAPLPTNRPPTCAGCDKPITRVDTASLACFNWDSRRFEGWWGTPRDWRTLRVDYVHDRCAPDFVYCIALRKLAREGVTEWARHMAGKRWWAPTFEYELQAAYAFAQRLGSQPARGAPQAVRRPKSAKERSPRAISAGTRARILERDRFRCQRCGARAPDAELVIDHITPVALGGTADETNLQALCTPCNAGKAARPPHAHDLRTRSNA